RSSGSPLAEPFVSGPRVFREASGYRHVDGSSLANFANCQLKFVVESLDALVMDKIAGDQRKTMLESDRCNHRVNAANRLPCPLQVGENSAGNFGAGPIEDQDFGG